MYDVMLTTGALSLGKTRDMSSMQAINGNAWLTLPVTLMAQV